MLEVSHADHGVDVVHVKLEAPLFDGGFGSKVRRLVSFGGTTGAVDAKPPQQLRTDREQPRRLDPTALWAGSEGAKCKDKQ